MHKLNARHTIIATTISLALLALTPGCENLPGTHKQQGAAIGGVGGAVAGAAIGGENNRLLGAVLGGAIGAGAGYVVGANSDRILNRDQAGAQEAMHRAETAPATPQQAMNAPTADLNNDGFVTMDEVIALRQAGVSDQAMLDKLHATGQVFELTPAQQRYLEDRGVSHYVVQNMMNMNRDVRDRLLSQDRNNEVIGRPSGEPIR